MSQIIYTQYDAATMPVNVVFIVIAIVASVQSQNQTKIAVLSNIYDNSDT